MANGPILDGFFACKIKMQLKDYISTHDPKQVVVLADSSYDIENIKNNRT
jgi:hypothetical protein